MVLKIKKQYGENHVAFGGMGKTKLKDYGQKDLKRLAILAQQSKDRSLLNLFDGVLPALSTLQDEESEELKKGLINPTLTGPVAKEAKTQGSGNETDKQKENKA